MIGTRYEEYEHNKASHPFVLFANEERSSLHCSAEMNWHENLELQFCVRGTGTVLLNGEQIPFSQNNIIAVNSNVIHYTAAVTPLCYSALIIDSDFCKQMGIDYEQLQFVPLIQKPELAELFMCLQSIYLQQEVPFKNAKLTNLLLQLLIELAEHFSEPKEERMVKNKAFENVKEVIRYIHRNFNQSISLDELAEYVYADKYALSREFKKMTGQTIVEYLNQYRCQRAADCITSGANVSEAAQQCGFHNLSYFTRTFKNYRGMLPSDLRKFIHV